MHPERIAADSFSDRELELLESSVEDIRVLVRSEIDINGENSDEKVLSYIDRVMTLPGMLSELSIKQKKYVRCQVFDFYRGLDILQELLDDPGITEIMVNGTSSIYCERGGKLSLWRRRFSSRTRLEDLIQRIVSEVDRSVNTFSPIVDARLADGSRVNAVLPPAAPDGPILTIRRFPKEPLTLDTMVDKGSLTEELKDFLIGAVEAGCNIFISGGTGSGKTTFLNALSRHIPPGERVITIEDSLELQLGIDDLVRLEVKNDNLGGSGGIGMRDLIRTALRMRPDRLIVGEIRGPEALDMLQAMNTGHDGSLSTGHANSSADMLSRIETMVLMGGELPLQAVRSQISSALDIMIHLERRRDGLRRVADVSEVIGQDEGVIKLRRIFERDAGGSLRQTAAYSGEKAGGRRVSF